VDSQSTDDKDGPQPTDPCRHGRIRFTSEALPRDNKDSAFPRTGHDRSWAATGALHQEILLHWPADSWNDLYVDRNIFSRKRINWGSRGLCSSYFSS